MLHPRTSLTRSARLPEQRPRRVGRKSKYQTLTLLESWLEWYKASVRTQPVKWDRVTP